MSFFKNRLLTISRIGYKVSNAPCHLSHPLSVGISSWTSIVEFSARRDASTRHRVVHVLVRQVKSELLVQRATRVVGQTDGVCGVGPTLRLLQLLLLFSSRVLLLALGFFYEFGEVGRRRVLLHGSDPLEHGVVVGRLKEILAVAERAHFEHALAFGVVICDVHGGALQVDGIGVRGGNHDVVLFLLAEKESPTLLEHGPGGSPRAVRRALAVFAHDLAVKHALFDRLEQRGKKFVRGNYVLTFDCLQNHGCLLFQVIRK